MTLFFNCRSCGGGVESFLDLGNQPPANALSRSKLIEKTAKFRRLEIGRCSECQLVQNCQGLEAKEIFLGEYSYFTSANHPMINHFEDIASRVKQEFLPKGGAILEIGSNDGTFLKHFKTYQHLGFDPSTNVAEVSINLGLSVRPVFFNEDAAQDLLNEGRVFDVVYAANVMGHVPDIKSVISAVGKILSSNGVFITEIYYLGDILNHGSFDLMYDEHVFFFSLDSFNRVLQLFGLTVFRVEKLKVHGGSIRFFASKTKPVEQSVLDLIELESNEKVNDISRLKDFSLRALEKKNSLVTLLNQLRREGFSIAALGASAKATTLLNYCKIDHSLLDCIYDTTQFKVGRYTVGSGLLIKAASELEIDMPDYCLVLAWNYTESIISEHDRFSANNGRWIVPFPDLVVV